MEFIKSEIPEIFFIEPKIFRDNRGFFLETYVKKQFDPLGINYDFVQDNYSGSHQGTLRGLHYQIRQPQGKLIRATVGEVFDVAVDLRKSSATFGKWIGCILSAEQKNQIWIPPGFAHGFYVISDWAEVYYKATDYYAPEWERTLLWNDPEIGIQWPLISGRETLVSTKDMLGASLQTADIFG